jgi:hypothetical protein
VFGHRKAIRLPTWHGEWKGAGKQVNRVVVFMAWDGKNITGMINPGPSAVRLKSATLQPKGWMVHLEGDSIVIDGAINDIGSYNRTITGTWTQGQNKGELKLIRD